MPANDFAQTTPDAITDNRSANCTRGDKACPESVAASPKKAQDNKLSSFDTALLSDPIEVGCRRQSSAFGKREAFCRTSFCHVEVGTPRCGVQGHRSAMSLPLMTIEVQQK
jgi:hypothetical protein